MKLNSLKVPTIKPAVQQAKTTVVPARMAPIATAALNPPAKHVIAGDERRRGQRVLLRVHASVHVAVQGKEVIMDATTLSVNTHGALVVMKQTLPAEARLVLEHGVTREKVVCKIARPAREMPEGYHIPLEFDSPAPNFWGIAFPPTDWRPPDDL